MEGKKFAGCRKNKITEWVIIILLMIFCGLFSRFYLKELVSDENYKTASFGLLVICFLIFYPLLCKIFIKKGK